ncbi:MAG: GNAT family N-acetyltransferase [Synergistaceae bacterium]|nr:GNAT family N-acetyltransferase [Synergistaceae bacterium]
MSVSTRAMDTGDWQAVAEIYRQGIQTGDATLEAEVPAFEKWDAAHKKNCRIVAVLDGVVVGWVALSPVSGRRVYVGVTEVSIYVSEEHRGEKVGQILLNALIEESEKEGYWTLQSSIAEENVPSVALHHKCGFRTVGVRERLGRDPEGKWRNLLLLERRSGKVGL